MSLARPLKFLSAIVVEFGSLAMLVFLLPQGSGEQHTTSAAPVARSVSEYPATPLGPGDRQRFVEHTLDSSRERLVSALEAHVSDTLNSVIAR